MVDGLVELHLAKYRESGAELVMGSGRFVSPKTIEVTLNAGGARTLRGRNVVINTGSRARLDDARQSLRQAVASIPRDAVEAIVALVAEAEERARTFSGTTLRALEAGDREDELADWLDERGIEGALDLAPTFVSAGLDAEWLSRLTEPCGAHLAKR